MNFGYAMQRKVDLSETNGSTRVRSAVGLFIGKGFKMESWVGQRAAEFKLNDTDGRGYSSEGGLGRWQLLVFHRHLG